MATSKKQNNEQESNVTDFGSTGRSQNTEFGQGLDTGGAIGSSDSMTGGTGNIGTGQSTSSTGSTGQNASSTGSTGQGTGQSSLSTAGQSSGGGGTGAGTATARSFYDQAKETAGHAYEAAAEKATTKLEEQKSTLSGGLSSVADSVRKVSENLRGPDVQDGISKFTAEYSDAAARKIEDVATYFEQKSVREMYSDVENFARRNPAVFVGGAFALGLIAARFLKSGARTGSAGDQHRLTSGNTAFNDFGGQADTSRS